MGRAVYEKNTPEGWTTRHIEDARRFIEKWPVGKQSVNAQNIQEYFKLLGFHVECCAKSTRGNEVCCTLTVHKQNRIWQIIATPFPSSAHR